MVHFLQSQPSERLRKENCKFKSSLNKLWVGGAMWISTNILDWTPIPQKERKKRRKEDRREEQKKDRKQVSKQKGKRKQTVQVIIVYRTLLQHLPFIITKFSILNYIEYISLLPLFN